MKNNPTAPSGHVGSSDLLAVPEGWQNYSRGAGCQCYADNESECGCGVDWTPREIYELRDKINRLMQCVTTEHETKEAFIGRVRAILAANIRSQPHAEDKA